MRLARIFFLLFVVITLKVQSQYKEDLTISYVDFVNPLVGSDSSFDLSNGNTYPAIEHLGE